MVLIAIDDGHGMETAGKRSPILETGGVMRENEFNRKVAAYLKEELERNGFSTLLTAPGDNDVSLRARTDLANQKKADIFISIHANANNGKWGDWGGIETFYYNGSSTGKVLADTVHKHIIKGSPLTNRGVKSGDFHVIRESKMPAILIECGFMDSKKDITYLLSDVYRKETAKEIAVGLCEYFKKPYIEKVETKKDDEMVLKADIANNIITSFLQPAWSKANEEYKKAVAEKRAEDAKKWLASRDWQHTLAEELRKASGQNS